MTYLDTLFFLFCLLSLIGVTSLGTYNSILLPIGRTRTIYIKQEQQGQAILNLWSAECRANARDSIGSKQTRDIYPVPMMRLIKSLALTGIEPIPLAWKAGML